MKARYALILFAAGLILLGVGCGTDDDITGSQLPGNGKIAYIYEEHEEYNTPTRFKEFLDGRGYPTDLIEMEEIVPDRFSEFVLPDYSLIIIDPQIGSGNNWGDSVRVALIELVDRPVLGVGFGGVRLFTELGLAINWYNCTEFSSNNDAFHTDISVHNTGSTIIDTSDNIFKLPNEIRFRYDSLVDLHYSAALIVLDYTDPDLPDDLLYFGRQPNESSYYSLVMEDRYFLWGFAEPPEEMTDTGLNMFENIVHYLINLE